MELISAFPTPVQTETLRHGDLVVFYGDDVPELACITDTGQRLLAVSLSGPSRLQSFPHVSALEAVSGQPAGRIEGHVLVRPLAARPLGRATDEHSTGQLVVTPAGHAYVYARSRPGGGQQVAVFAPLGDVPILQAVPSRSLWFDEWELLLASQVGEPGGSVIHHREASPAS